MQFRLPFLQFQRLPYTGGRYHYNSGVCLYTGGRCRCNSGDNSNPVLNVDPDGRDWIVSTNEVNGKTQINLTFAAAIMNSSGKSFDMQNMINNQVKEFESVFGQGNVKANLLLREICSTDELQWHESLIDIQSGSNFKTNTDGTYEGGLSRHGGKFIQINADAVNSDGSLKDKKAVTHEIGHTGGLVHPWEFDNKDVEKVPFVNGNAFTIGVQPYYNAENNIDLDANFMTYSTWAAEQSVMNVNITPDQKTLYFMNNVGKATEGQTQQIINNLYNGNLNSDKDLPKK